MTQTHPEVNYVIQLAAGIANFGVGHVTTAKAHFIPLQFILHRQLHVPVIDPVMPCDLGILGPTEGIARKFNENVDRELGRYPNAQVLFIAHSLGGLLVRNHLLQSQETHERTIGLITLGTPHDGVEETRWGRVNTVVGNINGFARDIKEGCAKVEDSTDVVMTATTLDAVVPVSSALSADTPGERHVYAHPGAGVTADAERHINTGIDHNGLVAHPQAVMHVTHLARQLLAQEAALVPLAETA
jgi:pimeloyl-ACP methyl ester carboxylesterase